MKVYVSHDSALWYWRHASDYPRTLTRRCDTGMISLPDDRMLPDSLQAQKMLLGPEPIQLLAPHPAYRPQKKSYDYHVCSKALPRQLFCILDDSLLVASPELCFAQKAREIADAQVAELFMELTGKYALREETRHGFATRHHALMTRAAAMTTLQALIGKKRYGHISTMLKYAAEGSRSPMETRQYLLLFLPKRYGGYGLPKGIINAEIVLTPEERTQTHRRHIECDLYWPCCNIALEYDGGPDHASFEDRSRDATKRNVLQARKTRVFTVTAKEILDSAAFDAIAHNIASALNFRLRGFPADWMQRRDKLRNELFESMGTGHFGC